MEISSVQNFYRTQNVATYGRVKRNTEETTAAATLNRETDTVDLSSEASFRATLAASARSYAAQSTQSVSAERIAALKQTYAGDNVPVSGGDIASSIMRAALGLAE